MSETPVPPRVLTRRWGAAPRTPSRRGSDPTPAESPLKVCSARQGRLLALLQWGWAFHLEQGTLSPQHKGT